MAINGINSSYSGLQANQVRMDVSANNVANVNTDGFKAATVQTSDAAYINDIGQGTRVSSVYSPQRPGAPVALEAGAAGNSSGVQEMSNTDLAVETIKQMNARNAYGVNTAAFRASDEVNQTLLNLQG